MSRMKPFFPYFGSKYRLAKRYPEPNGVVIEPFAGSACYSTYWGAEVSHLSDLDPTIARVWRYLISATPDEIWGLPDVYDEGESPWDYGLREGAADLIGFWLTKSVQPALRRGSYASSDRWRHLFWRPQVKERIASQVDRIKGWTIEEADFQNQEKYASADSTTFVDPPYIKAGHHYKVKFSEYERLGKWAQSLPGRVIVCEGEGADWLPFVSLGKVKSFATGSAEEKVWVK